MTAEQCRGSLGCAWDRSTMTTISHRQGSIPASAGRASIPHGHAWDDAAPGIGSGCLGGVGEGHP